MLFNRDNFFKDLEFYDVQGMSDGMFRKLKVFCDHALFKPETVKDGSAAAASLCMWVRAVYDYAVVYRALKPKRKLIQKAEKELEQVSASYLGISYQVNPTPFNSMQLDLRTKQYVLIDHLQHVGRQVNQWRTKQ